MKIFEALNFLNFYTKIREKDMPIKTAYKLNKLARRLENEQVFYQEKIQKILNQYAIKDEDGNIKPDETGNIRLVAETVEDCEKELNELQNLEIEDINVSFTLDELEGLQVSPMELSSLFSLITE